MNKKAMLNEYHRYNKAELYIIGFSYGTAVYMILLDKIPQTIAKREKAGVKGYALRLRLNNSEKEKLLKHGAYYLCDTADLQNSEYNRGEHFEKVVTEFYGITWEKDYTPFYESGDITIDGQEIQIKYQNATITTEKQIQKLMSAPK